ncbi:hypothetical protein Xen7305DRAFT_00020370 [Xenococcus sp. PCC 7305]|uniref:hypothetical protein n=1 Tax=Xenococcus sp. PCC 7305 TaxID=102125 RepID=UPI0002ACB686|nr:hypothetical protein [Xenococcus sp. PCC 7305]ELS02323.1 hypothetical protein Xen7305DRAFT_00020370 [Xenococcus sp. PCC 7305]
MSISNFLKVFSVSCLAIANCSVSSIAQAADANVIELTYSAAQFQCGEGNELVDIQVNVYRNSQFVQTLSVEDSVYLPINSFDDLTFQYNFIDAECAPIDNPEEMVLAPEDPVPDLAGVYEQDSLQEILDGLNEYEELFIVELGTSDSESSAYDFQDVVMLINNKPAFSD